MSEDCVEQGYLLLPAAQRLLSSGDFIKAHDCAAEAARIGEHFEEPDLISFARSMQATCHVGRRPRRVLVLHSWTRSWLPLPQGSSRLW